jgi:hypothetical protein
MTVVVGVPTYYSEKSRMMIRFSQYYYACEDQLIFIFAGAVTALTKLGFKYQGLCLNQQQPVWNMVSIRCDACWKNVAIVISTVTYV